ncbi:Glu-tRNA(Gln) amidotransferase GatDE subunit D [archaeon SCG-AAA382B04]|nr:Glu-tRNA(Gln) amidotransferase GatDE subunit D [archaeon SCG-AAA382B04]
MKTGDKVKIKKDGTEYIGKIMPSSKKEQITLKLDNGYNVGIKLKNLEIEKIKGKTKKEKTTEYTPKKQENLPTLSILTTGGTIASSVDYRTGAVTSQFDAKEILENIPELEKIANYKSKVVFNILSENMSPKHWIELSNAISEEIKQGTDGIIIAHGTDTMAYTASAISFMINSPIPIIFVGSQRSADRPSSDNVLNAICAAKAAKSDIAETMIVMHSETSDTHCYAHRATKARKMHTSRRDAFRSINNKPIAKIDQRNLEILDHDYQKRNVTELETKNDLNSNVSLIKYSPGLDKSIFENMAEKSDGIIIEGTGLGHVSRDWISSISTAIKEGTPVVITSQCLYGRVSDRVYNTGRDLIDAGVIQAEDMLPEVAYVKLMWTLPRTSNNEEVREIMRENIAGEINERTKNTTYLI